MKVIKAILILTFISLAFACPYFYACEDYLQAFADDGKIIANFKLHIANNLTEPIKSKKVSGRLCFVSNIFRYFYNCNILDKVLLITDENDHFTTYLVTEGF